MTKDEALKMAIEQIQHLIEIYIPSPEWSGTAIQEECYEAINACKEALEQPAQDYVLICKKCGDDLGIKYVPDKQPAQEQLSGKAGELKPVAYAYIREDGVGQLCWTKRDASLFKDLLEGWKEVPLYTKEKNHG